MAVEMAASESPTTIIEDGFDLAIHSGDLPDSTLVARRFAPTMTILVATPQYLTRFGAPESPEELKRFRSVVFVERGSAQPWSFGSGQNAKPESTDTLRSQSIEKAIGLFQQALNYDPNDALAYSGLADAYYTLSTEYRAPLEVMPKAKAAAVQAIKLDDALAEAHASLGSVALFFDWDWTRAEHEFRRALELNPNLPQAHAGYAEYLLFKFGRADEAMQELQCAYSLDPLLPYLHGDLAFLFFLARRYPESIETAHKVGHDDDYVLALSYAELGQRHQAVAAADRAMPSTKSPVTLSQIAAAYALAGKADKARAMLPGIEGQARDRYVCGFNVACLYSALGDKEQAFAWLEQAYRDRSD